MAPELDTQHTHRTLRVIPWHSHFILRLRELEETCNYPEFNYPYELGVNIEVGIHNKSDMRKQHNNNTLSLILEYTQEPQVNKQIANQEQSFF